MLPGCHYSSIQASSFFIVYPSSALSSLSIHFWHWYLTLDHFDCQQFFVFVSPTASVVFNVFIGSQSIKEYVGVTYGYVDVSRSDVLMWRHFVLQVTKLRLWHAGATAYSWSLATEWDRMAQESQGTLLSSYHLYQVPSLLCESAEMALQHSWFKPPPIFKMPQISQSAVNVLFYSYFCRTFFYFILVFLIFEVLVFVCWIACIYTNPDKSMFLNKRYNFI